MAAASAVSCAGPACRGARALLEALEPRLLLDGAELAAGPSEADYLIITADEYYEEVLPLAAWKHRKGYRTYVERLSEIPVGHGGDRYLDVFDYISNAYHTGVPTSFVLLVGDHEDVPGYEIVGHPYHGAGHQWATDYPYACVEGGVRPYLAIGRLSGDSEAQIATIVDKVLTYDRAPDAGDWYDDALVAGYFEDFRPTDGTSERMFMEDLHRIHDSLGGDTGYFADDSLNKGYTMHTALTATSLHLPTYRYGGWSFDGRIDPPDPVPAEWTALWTDAAAARDAVTAAVNGGVGIVLHRDHGVASGWQDPPFQTQHVGSLANGDRQPVVFSINCLTGRFDGQDCFAEAWQRQAGGGAVGVVAAARVSYSGYNDCLTVGLFDSFWDDIDPSWSSAEYAPSFRPAEALNRAKVRVLDAYGWAEPTAVLTARLFNYFGDPEMMLRTRTPSDLAVSYDAEVPVGEGTDLAVAVALDGSPVAGARVCISGADVDDYWVGLTGADGTVTFAGFAASRPGSYDLVVTALDGRPFAGTLAGVERAPQEITVLLGGVELADGQAAPVDFGSVLHWGAAPEMTLTVRNDGELDLTLGEVDLPAGYTLVEGLSAVLAGGESDSFTVQLDTSAVGTFAGEISFTSSDDDESAFNFAITGEVLALPAEITVLLGGAEVAADQAEPIDFGAVLHWDVGPGLTVLVCNVGELDLTLGEVDLPAGYTLVEGLSAVLAGGESDSFTVQLDTSAVGTFAGEISFTSSDDDERAVSFAVAGDVDPLPPEVVVLYDGVEVGAGQAGPIDFGAVVHGRLGLTRTFTVRNVGELDLMLGDVGLPAGYTLVEALACVLPGGQSDTFTVRLVGGAVGVKAGGVSVDSNDADEAPFTFAVAGEVVWYKQTGANLVVYGTAGDDDFRFTARNRTYEVRLAALRHVFDAASVASVRFDGRDGSDTARLFGSAGADVAVLRPTRGALTGEGYTVRVLNLEHIRAYGGGGDNVARLYDSPGADAFWARPTHVCMRGDGFYNYARGFARADGRSQAGGRDAAKLYDSRGDDRFSATVGLDGRTRCYLKGAGFDNRAYGFAAVRAYADGSQDTADAAEFQYPRQWHRWFTWRRQGLQYASLAGGESEHVVVYGGRFNRYRLYQTS